MARYSANCSGCGKPIGSGHTRWCPVRRRLAAGLAVAALLLCVGRAAAQEVPLKIDGGGVKVVQVDQVVVQKVDRTLVTSFPFSVQAPPGAGIYFWAFPAGVTATDLNDRLDISAAPKGELSVSVKMVNPKLDKDGRFIGFDTRVGRIAFYVGEVQPGPAPVPPDPKPVPPDPVGKFSKALIVYETADLSKMARPQHAVLFAKSVRDHLQAKTSLEPDGKTRAWRIFDKDVDASTDSRGWKELLARPRASTPWIILTDGAGAVIHEGPLPADVNATLELLKRFGG